MGQVIWRSLTRKFGDIVNEVPEDAEVTDYSGQWIAPGLVDTHIHGFMNHDVMDNLMQKGSKLCQEGYLSCGVILSCRRH